MDAKPTRMGQDRYKTSVAALLLLGALGSACSIEEDGLNPGEDAVGKVHVSLEGVPKEVLCIRLDLKGSWTEPDGRLASQMDEHIFDVSNPDIFVYLPSWSEQAGTVTVSGEAFNGSCAFVTTTSPASWRSQSVEVVVKNRSAVSSIALSFQAVSSAIQVAVEFEGQELASTKVSAGGNSTCALFNNDRGLRCWGKVGRQYDVDLPRRQDLAIGDRHVCFTDGSQASCFGSEELGYAPGWNSRGSATDLKAGPNHVCAIDRNDPSSDLSCWGLNDWGQLGCNAPGKASIPNVITGGVSEVAVGGSATCAIIFGKMYCWGNLSPYYGSSYYLCSPNHEIPVTGPEKMALSPSVLCAKSADRTVKCMGDDSYGQLGNGPLAGRQTSMAPVLDASGQPLRDVVDLVAGDAHVCFLMKDTSVRCVGKNTEGQLGDGSGVSSEIPVPVLDLQGVTSLAVGANHTCALLENGSVRCWGSNNEGQLGIEGLKLWIAYRPIDVNLADHY